MAGSTAWSLGRHVVGKIQSSRGQVTHTHTQWRFCMDGCQLECVPLVHICQVANCCEVFHHCCHMDWEMVHFLYNNPGQHCSMCCYDLMGSKFCIHHHPFPSKIFISGIMTPYVVIKKELLFSSKTMGVTWAYFSL